MNCYDVINNAYLKFGNNFSLYHFNCKTEIKKFVEHVNILASYFTSCKIKKGDVFTIYMPNSIQGFAVFYALNKIGAIANIVHPLIPISTLMTYLKTTNSKGIIVLDVLFNKYAKNFLNFKKILIVAKSSDYVYGIKKIFFKLYEFFKTLKLKTLSNLIFYSNIIKHFDYAETKSIEHSVATYIHSGGTSGESKTIQLSNSAINSLTSNFEIINKRNGNKYVPVVLPIFHAFGLVVGVHAAIVQGYNLIIFSKFNAKKINNSMKKFNVETIISVPLMIKKMMREKNFYGPHLKNLNNVFCGGDVVDVKLQTEFNDAIKKYNGKAKLLAGYGLTETASVAAVNTHTNYKLGSVGKPLPSVKIEIWNEKNKKLPAGNIGEIIVSGATLMNSYLNSKDSGLIEVDHIKYLKTGDMGHFDSDGFLFVDGRKKNMIKIATYNVFPSEIEAIVKQLNFVDEVSAFEKIKKDRKIIKLIVKLKRNDLCEKDIKNIIFSYCKKNLIKYSIPSEIEIVKSIPRTAFGKIDYLKICKIY